jgi:hypothetical protein
MKVKYVKVTFEENEFAEKFPDVARMNLNESDKVRVALGLAARKAVRGGKIGNKNALGNKSRWASKLD